MGTMAEDKKPAHQGRVWLKWFSAGLLLMGVMLYFYYAYPGQGIGPKQPIPFSHRVHAGVKAINCRFCHPYVERSEHAGLPEMEKCFFCHRYIIPTHPEILKEKAYLDSRKPVPWVRIFYVPDFVKFRHEPHLRWGKLDCTHCHGAVDRMDRLQKKEFKMKFCIDCHQEKKAQLDCWLACHH
ncbi:MAG: cytochrome c3 family protein [Deltaproteobacteria bacterium]|nr:cytochrome c3 family protein [Deltaproteobacteria bacterium]